MEDYIANVHEDVVPDLPNAQLFTLYPPLDGVVDFGSGGTTAASVCGARVFRGQRWYMMVR